MNSPAKQNFARPDPTARWRHFADWAKRHNGVLKLADYLSRGTGTLRFLDGIEFSRIPAAPLTPDLRDWETRDLSAVWLGHATVLLRIGGRGGLTILTDPVLSDRVGLAFFFRTAGPRRLVAPALREHQLPNIDLICLSHAHFDHLDVPTLRRLRQGPARNATIVTSPHNADLVERLRFPKVIELDPNLSETYTHAGVTVQAVPVKHWGARVFYDDHRGACAFLLSTPHHRVLYGADTAYQELWKPLASRGAAGGVAGGEAGGRVGGVDLAIVGIGAYDPWIANHATPEQAAQMAQHAGARAVLPMHHSTFKLSYEPMSEPMARLRAALPAHQIVASQIGAQWTLPPSPRATPQ